MGNRLLHFSFFTNCDLFLYLLVVHFAMSSGEWNDLGELQRLHEHGCFDPSIHPCIAIKRRRGVHLEQMGL